MKEFTPEDFRMESASALDMVLEAKEVDIHSAYVGLDVHKETIAVAVAAAVHAIQECWKDSHDPGWVTLSDIDSDLRGCFR